MSKNPAVNFYTSDFLTGTAFMTNEQVGAYIRLLSYQHQYGRLTEQQVLTITNDKTVLSKFKIDKNGLFYNQRMEFETEKKRKYVESRRNNRNKGNNDDTCVYLIKNIEDNLIKIGSSNNPKRRLLELKNQYNKELKIIAYVEHVNQKLEKELHDKYKEKNIFGEWYELTKKEIEKIIESNHMIQDMNNHMNNHMENENENININKNIIDYLNNKLNSKYKYSTKITKEKINARLNEGYTLDDFIIVIDKKCNEWLGTEFERFLRPETLFGTKFESYLNQPNRKYDTKPKTSRERLREIEEKFLKGE